MKKVVIVLSALTLLAGCSSFKPDYVVRDASEKSAPDWIADADEAARNKKELAEYRFFISDAENVNKRLCKQESEAQATQKVASEIAQEIFSRFEAEYKSDDDVANAKLKDKLQRNIQVNLHGVAVAKNYWEKRQYQVEMGASKDIVRFKCDTAVKISVKNLQEALNAYKEKTLKTLKGEEKKAMEAAVASYESTLVPTVE